MSGLSASEPATDEPDKLVRDALADPEVIRGLRAIIQINLRRMNQGAGRQAEIIIDECFSETCYRALNTKSVFDPHRGSVLNWLGGIAMKVLRERRKRQPAAAESSELDGPDRSRSIPEAISDRMEIEGLLTQLSTDEQQLLRWDYEERTAAEIGVDLGLDATTVRVRLHRLRRKIKARSQRMPNGGADDE